MPRFNVGEIVRALYRHKDWYPAAILKTDDDGYQVEWLDGSGRARIPENEVEALPVLQPVNHRFSVGNQVFAMTEYAGWFAAIVTAHLPYGYVIAWEDGRGSRRSFEDLVIARPRKLPDGRRHSIGEQVLGLYEDGAWFPATVVGTSTKAYDVVWHDGDGRASLNSDQILPYPALADVSDPERQETTTTVTSIPISDDVVKLNEASAFANYLTKRAGLGELIPEKVKDEQFCAACRSSHMVQWFIDKKHDSQFFLCNAQGASSVVVIDPATKGMKTTTIAQLMIDYPAIKTPPVSWLKRLVASSQLEVSPLPPFISVSVGKTRR